MNIRLSERMRKADSDAFYCRNFKGSRRQQYYFSFAGGLPNPLSFPVKDIEMAAQAVYREMRQSPQYSSTGFPN